MSKEPKDRIDPTKPALLVLYGTTKKKVRPLESDLVLLGRAPGCDIGLMSPEVAPVHCVLVRFADGWRIRDCSRATRVNGNAIHDAPLRNGDTIQLGTFSFEAHLPPQSQPRVARGAASPVVPVNVGRLQQSRRRLVELALSLRSRLRDQGSERESLAEQQAELLRQQADLEQLERRLRRAHEEQRSKQGVFTDEQKELARRAGELDQYAAHLRRHAKHIHDEASEQMREVEADLARERARQKQAEEELARLRLELEARQAEVEEEALKLAESVKKEREQVAKERQELIQQRIELERQKELQMQQTPLPASSRDTQLEVSGSAKIEAARKLLREIAERRKPASAKATRSRQGRPQGR